MPSPPRGLSPAFLLEYDGRRLINTAIAFIVLEIVLVALRFWVRLKYRSKLSWDDYLVLPSLVFCIGVCVLGVLVVQHGGVGRHIEYVEQFPDKLRYWYQSCLIAVPCVYMMACAFPKLAILAVYLEVFVDKFSRVSCWILVFIVGGNAVANLPSLIFKCNPISYGWDPSTPGGWCANVEPRLRYGSLPHIVTDVAMILLPIPMMLRLHTNKVTKVGLACTLATGSIGLITSCLRIANFFSTAAFSDGTWASVDLVIWCIVEPGVYLFAACFIAFRPLVMHVWRETLHYFKSSRSHRLGHKLSEGLDRSIEMHKAGTYSQRLTDLEPGDLVRGCVDSCAVDAVEEHGENYPYIPEVRVDREFARISSEKEQVPHAV